MNDTYLYPYSSAEARDRKELPLWRESHKANIACRNAIEDAIRQSFDGMHLDKNCLTPVLEEYGYKRTAWVLANTLHELKWDGRFGHGNKQWAERACIPKDINHNGMADDTHAYELIRCVRLFPGDAQGEDVLAADYRRDGLTKKNADLKSALDICLETLRPRFLLEPERLVPVPQRRKLRKELREALLWQGYEENYDSAIRAVFVEGAGWLSPQDVKKQRQIPLVLRYRVDGMTKDGAYLSLEVEPWEYDLLLEQTRDHYKMKKH